MKKYNVKNYVRYKEDVKACMPDDKPYNEYTRKELITKFLPLVENIARKFSTTQQASGVLSINDLIQIETNPLRVTVYSGARQSGYCLNWTTNNLRKIKKSSDC